MVSVTASDSDGKAYPKASSFPVYQGIAAGKERPRHDNHAEI
jgi:hypothetical protein